VSKFTSYDALLESSATAAAALRDMKCTWLPLFEETHASFALFPTPVTVCE